MVHLEQIDLTELMFESVDLLVESVELLFESVGLFVESGERLIEQLDVTEQQAEDEL